MPQVKKERRLAAILAADIVNYSGLMEADEVGTHATIRTLRSELIEPQIADHRGRIVKLMGNGALCEFASVVDAVACAVAIQKAMAEPQQNVPESDGVRFRIGVNLATSWSRMTAISTVTGSMWRPGSSSLPSPAAC